MIFETEKEMIAYIADHCTECAHFDPQNNKWSCPVMDAVYFYDSDLPDNRTSMLRLFIDKDGCKMRVIK